MALVETLRDTSYAIIGYIYDEDDKLILRDACGAIQGYYDKNSNTTRDVNYTIVAYGNLLTTLL